jgi:hypothetical protein
MFGREGCSVDPTPNDSIPPSGPTSPKERKWRTGDFELPGIEITENSKYFFSVPRYWLELPIQLLADYC